MVNKFVLKRTDDSIYGYLNNLDDFINVLPKLPVNVIDFHIREDRNDFMNWLSSEFSLNLSIDSLISKTELVKEMADKVNSCIISDRKEIMSLLPFSFLNEKEILKEDEFSLLEKIVNFLRKIV